MAGIGAENIRTYGTLNFSAISGYTNYTSDSYFMGHFGGGPVFYVYHNVFVRPEAHIYLIHNNYNFSGPWAARFAASIGYTFRPEY